MTPAEILHAIVAVPSPTGQEEAAVSLLRRQAAADGLRVLPDPVGNFVAEAGQGPRLLLFVGHIDTVPGHIPVRVEGRTLWGRGSVDAKGPLVAAYCAALAFRDSREVTIRIVGAIDEEGNSRGAKAISKDLRPEWILIGEPSGVGAVTLGYKGIIRGTFRLERPHHHGAHPGPTATEEAIAAWGAVNAAFAFRDTFDDLQGHLTSLVTEQDGLSDSVTGHFNIRVPPGTPLGGVEAGLRERLAGLGASLHVEERVEPALASKRTPLVAAFLHTMREAGLEPRLLRKTGTADFNLFANRYPGTPIVAYGPGDPSLDHTPEERLDLDEFQQSIAILERVIQTLIATPQPAAAPQQAAA